MQYLVIRISETGGNPWWIEIDNLSREDATDGERLMADNIEKLVYKAMKAVAKPGTFSFDGSVVGSRVKNE